MKIELLFSLFRVVFSIFRVDLCLKMQNFLALTVNVSFRMSSCSVLVSRHLCVTVISFQIHLAIDEH